jgi:hypothetical protein
VIWRLYCCFPRIDIIEGHWRIWLHRGPYRFRAPQSRLSGPNIRHLHRTLHDVHSHSLFRSTARGAKAAQLQERLIALGYGDKAEVVDVPAILHATLPLEGVAAVIHTASPLPGGDSTAKQIVDVRAMYAPR